MKKQKMTYHDIAEKAEVGIGTVSRYFNNYNISEVAKTKINKVLSETNYIPNFAASNIKKPSKDVYLILPYNNDETANMEIVNGVKSSLSQQNINFFIFLSSSDSEIYQKDLKYLTMRNPYGIVLLLPKHTSSNLILQIQEIKSTKLIVYNRNIEGINSVNIDDKEIFKNLAIKIDKSYKNEKIAFIGLNKQDITTGKYRSESFTNAIQNNTVKNYLLKQNSFEHVQSIIEKVIEHNPKIIVSATHTISMYVYGHLMENKIRNKFVTTDIGRMGKSQYLTNSDINIFIDYFLIGYKIGNKLLNKDKKMENFFKII
ncbi:LacI family DNA-binding transcriptional regulator [Mesoplasma tabanidae]|uniref:Trehalose operon repressor, repressor of treA,B,C n=1 Tax=Mesoplasma tabanidae TaxID=219745 RepID=A0A2K8P4R4_9MOLU|nr:LacI family DNA-binding transcriptional regulator [Mesoplasma tabanidae]ATZ21741.1 trehalose operon repressor, repressor of treA,B,C [Mesoplasma tabanidae]